MGGFLSRKTLRSAAVFLITLALALAVAWWNQRESDAGDDRIGDSASPSASVSIPASDVAASSATAAPTYEPVESTIRSGDYDSETGLEWITEADLPPEGRDTLRLIDAGGPYPFDRDGITFENREGILPDEAYGYYSEYTVIDPDSFDRGPKRIVRGEGGEFYFTEDHYGSFLRIYRE